MSKQSTTVEGVPLREVLSNDASLAAAFGRLLKEPAFSKIALTAWEYRLACEAPLIFETFGGYTWRQRRALRQIAKKIAR